MSLETPEATTPEDVANVQDDRTPSVHKENLVGEQGFDQLKAYLMSRLWRRIGLDGLRQCGAETVIGITYSEDKNSLAVGLSLALPNFPNSKLIDIVVNVELQHLVSLSTAYELIRKVLPGYVMDSIASSVASGIFDRANGHLAAIDSRGLESIQGIPDFWLSHDVRQMSAKSLAFLLQLSKNSIVIRPSELEGNRAVVIALNFGGRVASEGILIDEASLPEPNQEVSPGDAVSQKVNDVLLAGELTQAILKRLLVPTQAESIRPDGGQPAEQAGESSSEVGASNNSVITFGSLYT